MCKCTKSVVVANSVWKELPTHCFLSGPTDLLQSLLWSSTKLHLWLCSNTAQGIKLSVILCQLAVTYWMQTKQSKQKHFLNRTRWVHWLMLLNPMCCRLPEYIFVFTSPCQAWLNTEAYHNWIFLFVISVIGNFCLELAVLILFSISVLLKVYLADSY